jgi:hypothetical protein
VSATHPGTTDLASHQGGALLDELPSLIAIDFRASEYIRQGVEDDKLGAEGLHLAE